ncbi:MAG TPA: hypothetical protein PLO37_03660 [Candidatus Hydrogenedentes bacterium]|nr:hypothetical protein [Candidatus Hydrogenedentota bacterium]HPG65918.1 hypothetical protein [Candidatus Hydrogenedentota bacterium]
MSERKRVCAYYSHGPHFIRVIGRLREAYPDACITAIVPPRYPASQEWTPLVDTIERTETAHLSPRQPRACLRLLGHIRRARYDVFAVMFDSDQLALLAALSGAPTCIHGTMDGRLVPIRSSVMAAIAVAVGRNVWGRLVYATAWLAVRCLRVRGDQSN